MTVLRRESLSPRLVVKEVAIQGSTSLKNRIARENNLHVPSARLRRGDITDLIMLLVIVFSGKYLGSTLLDTFYLGHKSCYFKSYVLLLLSNLVK